MKTRPIAVVVDDSKPFLMYLSILLNRMNLEVLPVNNVAEAIELCRVTRPQLMTINMIMPGIDGLEALRQIRDDSDLSDLPVIMISGYQDKNRQWEALSLGCIDVLDKPVDLRRLHKAVQRCDLYPNGRRRYLRVPFEKSVELYHNEKSYQGQAVTLSERGIFVKMPEMLAKDDHVDIELPLNDDETLRVGGSVIYSKAASDGGSAISPGIAIKFDRMTMSNIGILTELVEELLVGDILKEQTEPVIKRS